MMQLDQAVVDKLNTLDENAASEALFRCCGSSRWVSEMLQRRPFADADALFSAAESIWWNAAESDWLEAFTHHPKIGDMNNLRDKFKSTLDWAKNEQASVRQASEETLQSLMQGNREYETRFGFIFIVCATGKSADEMLALLQERLPNAREDELKIAAAEQMKITQLRLGKLS